ncbi:methyltransferase domain-containing protein [Sporosarcina sp. PTS2304]|uniref:class I SAM-dependent methyltransferase n=1 Tax=Sporosarcina sp. PTS2304 TaxID=2283194 RepID=UPI000E0D98E6|nr:methyltransferase domain-containing protein [Sporosarcina sp. PTS2304]AXH99047.1 methyltransferase domain-containing protein [Sporosarcina sp. PTS2304]
MEENVFEQMANRYDTEDRIALAKVIVDEVKTVLTDSQLKSLVDYGCGTGLIGLELTDTVSSVLLVDSSQQMIEVVKKKIKGRGITNAQVLHSDFAQEMTTLKADIVLLSLVLLHVPDTEKILQEMFNSLHEGGQLLIVDFDKNDQISHPKVHNGFSHEELKNILQDIGFKTTEIHTFYHGERLFMNKDASMFLANSVK